MTYAEILKKARDNIQLESLRIEDAKIKRTMTGGILIEIKDDDKGEKADNLKVKLDQVLNSSKIRISCPVKRTQMRLSGIDDSITVQEIKEAVARLGDCKESLIECSEIRLLRGNLGIAWVQCPTRSALKIGEAGGYLKIGWSRIKAEALRAKLIQCFRCLAGGHTFQRCPSSVDRRDHCRKCGEKGHFVKECNNKTACPICKEKGKPANHRAGSLDCPPIPPKRGVNREGSASVNPVDRRRLSEQEMECEG